METLTTLLSGFISGIGPFFLLLGLLIFVHELGHYLVAVYFGVRVETFSLGFGKKIWSVKRGDTTYCLSLIPLGGYVKMYGDDPTATIPEEEKKFSFLHKPVWPRIAIVLAGPLMNLFFAIFIFSALGMMGENVPAAKLGDIEVGTPAYESGFRSGDTITEINSAPVETWQKVKEAIESNPEQSMSFTVQRETTGAFENVTVIPRLGRNPFIFSSRREVGLIDGLSTDSVSTMIGVQNSQSLAGQSGLKTFDVIEKVNGKEVLHWRSLERAFMESLLSGEVEVLVKSYHPDDKKTESRTVKLKLDSPDPQKPVLEQVGIMRSDLFLISVRPDSPASKAGLKVGDFVGEINGSPLDRWQTVLDKVKSFKPEEKSIRFSVFRENQKLELDIAPERIDLPTDQGAMESRFAIGVVPAIMNSPLDYFLQKTTNPFRAVVYGVEQSWEWSKLIAISLVRLVQNEVSARNIGGVITIGRVASKSFEVGMSAFLKMMAIISINLFLLNLLPVPVLDGGHLVFFTLEAIKGKPISFKKLEIAQQVGLVLLMSLMVFALFNDISHLISSW